jgi:putative IMPACT (imprinted ancient) family translation regulator
MRDDSRQGGLHPVNDVYRTIMGTGEGGCREKGSRFLGFAFPIRGEGEAEAHLAAMAEKYHDARHHCYAWRLGPDGMRCRASDAGEPHHSAGDPILNAIRRRQLCDVLVVVVRYFG